MKINSIIRAPKQSLNYMERLVNNGSPSGFSFKYTTSINTSPLYVSEYKLCNILNSKSNTTIIGEIPHVFTQDYSDLFFLHPDWKNLTNDFEIADTNISVTPTASFRTVKLLDRDYYIKMSYPGILGRITRELKKEHIYSSIDITNVFNQLLSKPNCPNQLAFFPENGGKLFETENNCLGFVIREAIPKGKNIKKISALIPAFSLYSIDRESTDIPLIVQMLEQKEDRIGFLLEQLLFPVIDCYFFCVFSGGIQPEMHSQNFLIGIDESYDITSIVFRDLESFDKDIELFEKLYPNLKLNSYPYKCIDKRQYNYKIKHSFMFDHKLGEYFFDPIINCLVTYGIVSKNQLEDEIKQYVIRNYKSFLTDFFPNDNCCYKFENVLIDRKKAERPYICFYPPKYR